jgi:glycine C-acetyltransferase
MPAVRAEVMSGVGLRRQFGAGPGGSLASCLRASSDRAGPPETPSAVTAEMIIRSQLHGRFDTPEGTVLSLGSSDYLGLCTSDHVRARLITALEHYGTGLALGATMFSTPAHRELAERLAAFLGYEAVALLGSGTMANAAAFMTLARQARTAVVDEESHPSIFLGAQLSRLELTVYPHRELAPGSPLLGPAGSGTLIATDGIFSTLGHACDLDALLAAQDVTGATILLDDAHGIGAVGPTGRGTCEAFDRLGGPTVQTGSFSKALGGAGGGYVAGPADLIDEIEGSSIAFSATTRIGVHTAVAALAALELIAAQPARIEQLQHLSAHLRRALDAAGIAHSTGITPITIVDVGDEQLARRISEIALKRGYFIPSLLPPVVAPGSARLRLIPSLDHTEEDLDAAIAVLSSAWQSAGEALTQRRSWQRAS